MTVGSRPAVLAAGLVVLVSLGGCAGLAGDARTTVTPAPVPTRATPATPTAVVPGIGGDGDVSPSVVVGRHRRALSNDSYRFTYRRTVSDGERTRQEVYVRSWVARNGSEFRVLQYVNESVYGGSTTERPMVDIYFDGSTVYFRETDSTGRRYVRAFDVDEGALPDPAFTSQLREVLAVADLRLAGAGDADGSRRFVGVAPVNESALDAPPNSRDVRNVRLVVELNDTGFVRRTRVRYETTAEGRTLTTVETMRVAGVGSTEVPAPYWLVSSGESGGENRAGAATTCRRRRSAPRRCGAGKAA